MAPGGFLERPSSLGALQICPKKKSTFGRVTEKFFLRGATPIWEMLQIGENMPWDELHLEEAMPSYTLLI